MGSSSRKRRAVSRTGRSRSTKELRAKAPAGAPLEKLDYERLAELRYLLRRFLIFSENAAAAADLTAQQHQALLAIKGYPGRDEIAIGALAERLGIRHASAVGLVDRLVAKGLVTRSAGRVDRRQILIRLTPDADTRLAALSVAHRAELRRLGPVLQLLLAGLGTGVITKGRKLVF
ncbi:MAG: MarR family transcriptional regulator [Alphaproteobacteria bacterium]|nr:MarR family transcriptional regulator [Alphaproteobacteria bacterium]